MDYLNMMTFPFMKEHQYLAEPYRFLTSYPRHPFYVPDMYSSIPCPRGELRLRNIKAQLANEKLWRQFKNQETEMIITKGGRRMFPALHTSIRGLEPNKKYCIGVEMVLVSGHRYKYNSSASENKTAGWTESGPAEAQPPLVRRFYWHPDGVASGAHWEQQPVNFAKLKLTNNAQEFHGNILLTSMHKYLPRIWIVRCDHMPSIDQIPQLSAAVFDFPETEFIAVTAYQNENITKLKIDNNPFAKGFRENGMSNKRKRGLCDSTDANSSHSSSHNNNNSNNNSSISDDESITDGKSQHFEEALTPVSSQHSSPPPSPRRFCRDPQQQSNAVTSSSSPTHSYAYRPLTPDSPDDLANHSKNGHPQDLRKVKTETVEEQQQQQQQQEVNNATIVHRPWEDKPWFDIVKREPVTFAPTSAAAAACSFEEEAHNAYRLENDYFERYSSCRA